MFPADQHLEILINRIWIASWADRLLAFVSDFGAWKIWLLLLVILAVVLGNFRLRAAILAAGLAVGLSDGIAVNLLKHAVARPRPSQVEPGVRMVGLGSAPCGVPKIAGLLSEPIISFPQGTEEPGVPGQLATEGVTGKSFPSGHAANNMAVATVLILFFGWRGALYLPFALLIGYARLYTGAHWPFDVLGGFLLGLIGGILAVNLVEILWRRFGPRLVPTLALRYPSLLRSS
ncbi:MAG: phosphatase PAP2 family protein [Proteobacteria bacterium]|jgi:undecaprenyl-diphosphatase|nr:phosphatase PAP2 family protein [Pseudomonadota bacterium]